MAEDSREIFWKGVTQIEADIFERCWFGQIASKSNYPEFEFRVSMEKELTGEIINELSLKLRPDERFWQYTSQHPLWSKDPRPLLLISVRDILWQLKLVPIEFDRPFGGKIALAAIQGGTVYCEVTGKVFKDFGGVHVIQAANYANTHVFDQLEKVFQSNPGIRPAPTYARSVIDGYVTDRKREKIYMEKIRARRLKLRRRSKQNHEPVKIFIDESGDIGFRSMNQPYVLCAYVLPSSSVPKVEKELRDILIGKWQSPPKEMHFNKISGSKLRQVLPEIEHCLLSNPGFCVCFIGHKTGFLAYLLRCEAELNKLEEKPIKTAWAYKLETAPTAIARPMLILMLEELLVHIAAESVDFQTPMDIVHDRKHRPWMNDALEAAYTRSSAGIEAYSNELYGRILPSKRTFSIVNSMEHPCLWISDWICWEMTRWWKGEPWNVEFEKCFQKITFITFDEVGKKVKIDKPEGQVIDEFVDLPRDIETI